MKVILRPHNPVLDGELPDAFKELLLEPHLWIGVAVVLAKNTSDAPVTEVDVDLLSETEGMWTLLGHRHFDKLGSGLTTAPTWGGQRNSGMENMRGRVYYTDEAGDRWEMWHDGTRRELS